MTSRILARGGSNPFEAALSMQLTVNMGARCCGFGWWMPASCVTCDIRKMMRFAVVTVRRRGVRSCNI